MCVQEHSLKHRTLNSKSCYVRFSLRLKVEMYSLHFSLLLWPQVCRCLSPCSLSWGSQIRRYCPIRIAKVFDGSARLLACYLTLELLAWHESCSNNRHQKIRQQFIRHSPNSKTSARSISYPYSQQVMQVNHQVALNDNLNDWVRYNFQVKTQSTFPQVDEWIPPSNSFVPQQCYHTYMSSIETANKHHRVSPGTHFG